ncbi:hypothetical protein SOPP22_01400 [Shewanella sp. OPT22]|nr:hypothetical protein SOPP22_01400 [Shewanella sp. OPT22]
MRAVITIALLFFSTFASAGLTKHCGEVQRMRTWVNGSDTYGVRVEFKANPQRCLGGFYMKQTGNNRELVYATILAAKMANQAICFQVNDENADIGNMCRINYVYHP